MSTPVYGAAAPAIEARFFAQGMQAGLCAANPYRLGTAAADWWQRGHDAARGLAMTPPPSEERKP